MTLLRAAAKNHIRVTIASSPSDYDTIVSEWKESGKVSDATKRGLALKAFEQTKGYDEAISDYFRKMYASLGEEKAGAGVGYQRLPLRYGANPHQKPAQAFVEQGEMPVKGELSRSDLGAHGPQSSLEVQATSISSTHSTLGLWSRSCRPRSTSLPPRLSSTSHPQALRSDSRSMRSMPRCLE